MSFVSGRLDRERRTIAVMIHMYCRDHHGATETLCLECRELLEYAEARLARCPFQEGKTTCAKCPVHCYKPARREQVRAVMRYAGPRMPRQHPVLALWHLADGLRRQPLRKKAGKTEGKP